MNQNENLLSLSELIREKQGGGIEIEEDVQEEDQPLLSISDLIQEKKKEEEVPLSTQVGRSALQFGLGLAEASNMFYDFAVSPLASKDAQAAAYRAQSWDDFADLQMLENLGVATEYDKELKESYEEQLKDPEKLYPYVQTADITTKGLIEKATGIDLEPQNIVEKGSRILGWIRNPTKLVNLSESITNPKQVLKAITPSIKDVTRAGTSGLMWELAEAGQFGPIGTIASMVVGDVLGGGIYELIKNPKKAAAQIATVWRPKEKLQIAKKVSKEFKDQNLDIDVGTLLDSPFFRFVQSRSAQSQFTGKAAKKFGQELGQQFVNSYEELANGLGKYKYETNNEAGHALKNTLTRLKEADNEIARTMYKEAVNEFPRDAYATDRKLLDKINKSLSEFKPGSIKGPEQKTVIEQLQKLKKDIKAPKGQLVQANVRELINNKTNLNSIINYEAQGGAKKFLRGIVKDLDRAIISTKNRYPTAVNKYISGNKKYSEHIKDFRNRPLNNVLRADDPATVLNIMDSIDGIKRLEKVFKKGGQEETFNALKRHKLDQMIGNKLFDNTKQQLEFGTFKRLLESPKNREILKGLLPKDQFKKLDKLSRNAGAIANTINEFYNSSKSATVAFDVAAIFKILNDVSHLLNGNPWPLVRTGAQVAGAKYLSNLLFDKKFIGYIEEAVNAAAKKDQTKLMKAGQLLEPYAQDYLNYMRAPQELVEEQK